MSLYLVSTDSNGVLLVERYEGDYPVADAAEAWPKVIYFEHEPSTQDWEITITLRLEPEDGAPLAEIPEAMANLADVMFVQAEDGLYRLGSPEAEGDVENTFLGHFLGTMGDAPVVKRVDR